jgi:hypothetical protein
MIDQRDEPSVMSVYDLLVRELVRKGANYSAHVLGSRGNSWEAVTAVSLQVQCLVGK